MKEYQLEYNGYYIKPHSQFPHSYVIVTTGRGGKVPLVLEGMFTTKVVAMEAIDMYMAQKPVKGSQKNEAIETSGAK